MWQLTANSDWDWLTNGKNCFSLKYWKFKTLTACSTAVCITPVWQRTDQSVYVYFYPTTSTTSTTSSSTNHQLDWSRELERCQDNHIFTEISLKWAAGVNTPSLSLTMLHSGPSKVKIEREEETSNYQDFPANMSHTSHININMVSPCGPNVGLSIFLSVQVAQVSLISTS